MKPYFLQKKKIVSSSEVNGIKTFSTFLAIRQNKLERFIDWTNISFNQVSISPTFYEQLLRQNPFAKKIQTQIVST